MVGHKMSLAITIGKSNLWELQRRRVTTCVFATVVYSNCLCVCAFPILGIGKNDADVDDECFAEESVYSSGNKHRTVVKRITMCDGKVVNKGGHPRPTPNLQFVVGVVELAAWARTRAIFDLATNQHKRRSHVKRS